ncbi:hypothetical protein AHF37_08295 [Paragonimus kellicotti]|nr:hypothetical protein AHF37_08295 [Paragonimus kellicotti]
MFASRRTHKNSIQLPSKRTVNRWKRRCILAVNSGDRFEGGVLTAVPMKSKRFSNCYFSFR